MPSCGYERCVYDAVEGKDKCIFHLEVKQKDLHEFKKHLACYLTALREIRGLNVNLAWVSQSIYSDRDIIEGYRTKYKRPPNDNLFNFRGAVFPEGIEFKGVTFDANVDFKDAVFTGVVDFTEARFLYDTDFSKSLFMKGVTFKKTDFRRILNFETVIFNDEVNFDVASLPQTNFLKAEFKNSVSFKGANFARVIFDESKFLGGVDFEKCIFHQDVEFKQAFFMGKVNFDGAHFRNKVDFNGSTFSRGEVAGFYLAEFHGFALFWNVKLLCPVNFRCAKFTDFADFTNAIFSGADFDSAQFHRGVAFSGSIHKEESKFENAIYKGEAFYHEADFEKQVVFKGSNFMKGADFERAIFRNNANFSWVSFADDTDFSGANIYGFISFSQGRASKVYFRNISLHDYSVVSLWDFKLLSEKECLVFEDMNMGKISFLHTEIFRVTPKVRFFNVEWKKEPEEFLFDSVFALNSPDTWESNNKLKPLRNQLPKKDELALDIYYLYANKYPEDPKELAKVLRKGGEFHKRVILDVERIANEIRRYYEVYGSYPDAGDFYIGEMGFKKKRINNWFQKFILFLYWLFSRYGERPDMVIFWILVLIFISTIAYMFSGIRVNGEEIKYIISWRFPSHYVYMKDIWVCFKYAITGLIPAFRTENILPSSWFFRWVEAFFGTSLIALFLLALRRRFKR